MNVTKVNSLEINIKSTVIKILLKASLRTASFAPPLLTRSTCTTPHASAAVQSGGAGAFAVASANAHPDTEICRSKLTASTAGLFPLRCRPRSTWHTLFLRRGATACSRLPPGAVLGTAPEATRPSC